MKSGGFLACFGLFAVLVGSAAAAVIKNTPVRIEQTVEAQFPAALAFSSVNSGEVRIVINIDADGKLADLLVASYTDKAFADEAVGLLRQWRYAAATENGAPIGVRMELRFDFTAKGRVVSLTPLDAAAGLFNLVNSRSVVTAICRPHELDQPLVAVQAVSPPTPPKTDAAAATTSSVLIDFYVDERGEPRMPVVVNSPPPAFAHAAVGALSQLRFTVPTRGGKPVAVRAQQEFILADGS